MENRIFMIDDFSGNGNIKLMDNMNLIEGKNNKEALNNL